MSTVAMRKEERIKDPNLLSWILRGVRSGATRTDVAASVRMRPSELKRWLERGEEALEQGDESGMIDEVDLPYARFFEDYMQAFTESKVMTLDELRTNPDWRARERWLVRVSKDYPDSDKKHIEITGAGGGPIEMVHLVSQAVQILDQEERQAQIARVEEFKRVNAPTPSNPAIEGQFREISDNDETVEHSIIDRS